MILFHREQKESKNTAIIDAFLLSFFPSRTLEELDEMDWPRFVRALEVKSIGETEKVYIGYQQGLIKAASITAKQWEQIREHSEILENG